MGLTKSRSVQTKKNLKGGSRKTYFQRLDYNINDWQDLELYPYRDSLDVEDDRGYCANCLDVPRLKRMSYLSKRDDSGV